jgi:hypothetical protein
MPENKSLRALVSWGEPPEEEEEEGVKVVKAKLSEGIDLSAWAEAAK